LTIERVRPDAAWNEWLEAAGAEGDFLQSGYWAEIDEAVNNRVALIARASSRVAALVSHAVGEGGTLTCLHGPVIADSRDLAGASMLLAEIDSIAREHACTDVRVVGRPPRSHVPPDALTDAFVAAGYRATPWFTSVVGLRADDETLLASFDRSVRKAVRRCEREGVSVRRCEDLEALERDFMGAYGAATGGVDLERARTVFALDRARHYAYYVAVASDGVVLATLGTYRFGGVVTEIMSVRTPAAQASGVPAQDLLHWEVMRRHRDLGDEWFDLAGFAHSPQSSKEEGIRRFKQKWGGVRVESPIFTKQLEGRLRRAAGRLRGVAT